ncbi:hypothetical protein D3C85_1475620 [compost metagenome]
MEGGRTVDAVIILADMPGALQRAFFLVITFRARMERNWQVLGSGFQFDVLGCRMRVAQACQVFEQQLGHLVSHFIRHVCTGD